MYQIIINRHIVSVYFPENYERYYLAAEARRAQRRKIKAIVINVLYMTALSSPFLLLLIVLIHAMVYSQR